MAQVEWEERPPFVPIVLIVVATQAPYLFFTPGKHDPEIWPFYGLAAGVLSFVFARSARLADTGLTLRGLGRGLPWLVAALAAWLSGLALAQALGLLQVTEGVDRLAPDLLRPFLARVALVLAVAILGDELAWRGVLLAEAQDRWGRWRGMALIAALSAAYRLPLLVRTGLIDDVPIGALVYGRELLRALALTLLFDRTRNLWLTGLFAFAMTAVPTLFLGDAGDPFEPLYFYSGEGTRFLVLQWIGEAMPVLVLGIPALIASTRSPSSPVTVADRSTGP